MHFLAQTPGRAARTCLACQGEVRKLLKGYGWSDLLHIPILQRLRATVYTIRYPTNAAGLLGYVKSSP